MQVEGNGVTDVARDYYNSDDADNFYFRIWGGEDIHVGIYQEGDTISEASRRTVQRMATLAEIDESKDVLDIGAGYGGAARFLVERFGCKVTCLNLSEVQNRRNREMNEAKNLEGKIGVYDGAFEKMPFADAAFDVVWCQDAILHSGEKEKVIEEVARVLRPGGLFIFTDPMQADEVPEGALDAVLKRIHLQQMGSFRMYADLTGKVGLEKVGIDDLSEHLPRHYSAVRKELDTRWNDLLDEGVSLAYLRRMREGLGHWIEAGNAGHLKWGILRYRKK